MLMHYLISGALLATLGGDLPVPDQGSWAAWHGCWRVVDDDESAGHLVCVLPGRDATEVRMVSIEDGVAAEPVIIRADGVARPVTEGGCTGTEVAHWSRDARRVFMRAELVCDGMHRLSTGAIAMVADDEWVNVQAATVSGQHATRTIRYVAVPVALAPEQVRAQLDDTRQLAREAARLRASAPLHVEDVVEAAGALAEPALQAMLAAQQLAFVPDARTLIRLEQAGVPASGIDVVVALGFPERFQLRETGIEPSERAARLAGMERCYDPVLGVYLYGEDCHYRGYYGYRSRWDRYGSRYYSPWGYDWYGWNYGSRPIVIIQPGNGEPRQSAGHVRGSGYTRGGAAPAGTARRRDGDSGGSPAPSTPQPSRSSEGSSRTAVPSSGGSSSPPAAAPAAPASGSSGGSDGSSSGGSRTAKPRDG